VKFRLHWRKQWYEFDVSRTQVKVITTENRTEQESSVYNRWHNRKVFIPPSPPVLERHRETPQNGGRVPHPVYLRPGWRAHRYLISLPGWKLADEEGIPFDREANERLRGLSRRDSLMQLLGEQQVKRKAPRDDGAQERLL